MHDYDDSFREFRCDRCASIFYLCRLCDHGQVYCGQTCGEAARSDSCRAANRRHQQSREGRRDHAFRQSQYRARKKVTDQGPQEFASSGTLCVGDALTATMSVAPTSAVGSAPHGPTESDNQTQPTGDADSGDFRRGRCPQGGASAADTCASTGSGDTARSPLAVVCTTPVRCAGCGRPGHFTRTGPLRRTRHRPQDLVFRSRGLRPRPPPPRPGLVL